MVFDSRSQLEVDSGKEGPLERQRKRCRSHARGDPLFRTESIWNEYGYSFTMSTTGPMPFTMSFTMSLFDFFLFSCVFCFITIFYRGVFLVWIFVFKVRSANPICFLLPAFFGIAQQVTWI